MFTDLLVIPVWNAQTNGEFIDRIKDYSDDEKCNFTLDIATELLKRKHKGNIISAEVILTYATQHYFKNLSSKETKGKIYYQLGKLYEYKLPNFIKAYTCYEKYTLNTENGGSHSLLMKALILRDDFKFSDNLEKEYRYSLGEEDLGLRNDRLYEALASYIINIHYGNNDEAEKMKKRLKGIVKGEELFFLDFFIRKDNVRDVLTVPDKVLNYVNSL